MVAFIQAASISLQPSATSLAVSLPAAAARGNMLCGACTWGGSDDFLVSITDNLGNSYTILNRLIGEFQSCATFYTNNLPNTPITLTMNLSSPAGWRAMAVHEVQGVALTAPLNGNTGQVQSSPGTGTDAASSGNIVTTSNGDYIFGAIICPEASRPIPVYTAGTGFTKRTEEGDGVNQNLCTEDRIQPVAGSIAATFTQAFADSAKTMVMAFKPIAGAQDTVRLGESITVQAARQVNVSDTLALTDGTTFGTLLGAADPTDTEYGPDFGMSRWLISSEEGSFTAGTPITTDSVSLSDSPQVVVPITPSPSETLLLTENLVVRIFGFGVSDTLSLSDTSTVQTAPSGAASDMLALTDTGSASLAPLTLAVSDTLAIADSVIVTLVAFMRPDITDTLVLTDTPQGRIIGAKPTATDTLSLVEALTVTLISDIRPSVSDTNTLSDTVAVAAIRLQVRILEPLVLVDIPTLVPLGEPLIPTQTLDTLRTVRYGTEMLTVAETKARTESAMVHRLPPSLYYQATDLMPLYQWLAQPLAQEMALWLESATVARASVLLRQAEGIDLDLRLQDYGLKRYNQRPDPIARQLGMNILFTPKGTLYAVQNVIDLLLDPTPHLLRRSGRHQYHLGMAFSHPVRITATYSVLTAPDGSGWHLFVRDGVLRTQAITPPGLDVTPDGGPWTTIDIPATNATTWQLAVTPAGVLTVSQTLPAWGDVSHAPLTLLDDAGSVWTFQANPSTSTLISNSAPAPPIDLLTPNNVQEYFSLMDDFGQTWYLWVTLGGTIAYDTIVPPGINVTPTGGPFTWLRLHQQDGTRWAVSPRATRELLVTDGTIAGRGTAGPTSLGVSDGSRWRLGIGNSGTIALSDLPPLDFQTASTAVAVLAPNGERWFFRAGIAGVADISPVQWPDSLLFMPWGEVAWYRFADANGVLRYLAPNGSGGAVGTVAQPTNIGWGVDGPFTVRDPSGQSWLSVMTSTGQLAFTALGRDDLPTPDPVFYLRDIVEVLHHVQSAGSLAGFALT